MKKLLLIILVLLFAVPSYAASVKLGWDYDATAEKDLTGYIFYYQLVNPQTPLINPVYTKTLNDPAAREVTIDNLWGGTEYKFWCVAYNAAGKSGDSNTVQGATPPFVPPADSAPITITIPGPATLTITSP